MISPATDELVGNSVGMVQAPPTATNATLPAPFSQLAPELQRKIGSLAPRVRERILTLPVRSRGHSELFRDACAMHRGGFSVAEQDQVLRARYSGYYREIPDREFEGAIHNAANRSDSGTLSPAWPPVNEGLVLTHSKGERDVEWLRANSPVGSASTLPSADVIDRLFLGNPLLCFADVYKFPRTERREWFRGKERTFPYIVPNAMRAKTGTTQEGKTSARSLENPGPMLTQVIEFDSGTLDEQANLIWHIQRWAPLRMALFSGGKSLHAWLDVSDLDLKGVVSLRRYAVALGADRATFTACQLVRTPNVRRENGNLQEVIYLR